jgi:hypothetical protein
MPAQKRQQPKKKIQRKKTVAKGRGAYYVSGGLHGSAKLGPFKAGAALQAGYSNGVVSIPKMSGMGAYDLSGIRHNVLIKPELPEMKNSYYIEGGTIVRHREYLGPVTTSSVAGEFKLESYPLNPAQSKTFPWLSQIAANYEEYRPNGLMFEFRSTASDAIASSTNLALGQVMLCTQYDPTDPEFSSDVELLNYSWAQSGKVSDNVRHYVECDPKQTPLSQLYTRSGGVSNPSDLRFSDFGRFSIATSGLQGTSVQIGQLWLTYEFIFYKPQLAALEAEAGGWFHMVNTTGVNSTDPLGNNPMANGFFDGENNLKIELINSSVNGEAIVRMPPQYKPSTYQLAVAHSGTAGTCQGINIGNTVDPAIQFINHYARNTTYANRQVLTPQPATSSNQSSTITWFSIDGDSSSHDVILQLSNFALSGTVSVDVYISQIPYINPSEY